MTVQAIRRCRPITAVFSGANKVLEEKGFTKILAPLPMARIFSTLVCRRFWAFILLLPPISCRSIRNWPDWLREICLRNLHVGKAVVSIHFYGKGANTHFDVLEKRDRLHVCATESMVAHGQGRGAHQRCDGEFGSVKGQPEPVLG